MSGRVCATVHSTPLSINETCIAVTVNLAAMPDTCLCFPLSHAGLPKDKTHFSRPETKITSKMGNIECQRLVHLNNRYPNVVRAEPQR